MWAAAAPNLLFSVMANWSLKNHLILAPSRLLKNQVTEAAWDEMKEFIKTKTKGYHHVTAIGSGGNINKIFSLSKRKEGKPLTLELLA